MRRLIGRFRVLLPPSVFVVLYAAFYLASSLPLIIASRAVGVAAVDPKFRNPPIAVHLVGMLIFGAYRAATFHPFFRPGYRKWLETTPWTLGKPLPVGPAHPTPGDALIVAAAGLPEWLSGDVHPITSYASALGGYLALLSVTFAQTGAWGFQYPVLFGLGLAVMLSGARPEISGAAVLASCLVAMVGLRRSFRHWPWSKVPSFSYDASKGIVAEGNPPPLGWPYDRLGPRRDPPPDGHDAAGKFLRALLVGWWIFALECVLGPGGAPFAHGGLVLNLVFITCAARVSTTIAGHAPPISLAGRIVRLRPLIPSYDQVFVAPLGAMFAAAAGPFALARAGVRIDVAVAACAAAAMMLLWLGGPDPRAWQLTARHRVYPGIAGTGKAGEFVRTG